MGRPYNAHNRAVDFQTPPEALKPLYPYIKPYWRVWESACGDGNIVEALRDMGYTVTATDVKPDRGDGQVDFLDTAQCQQTLFNMEDFGGKITPVAVSTRADCIVTNPPYSRGDMDAFIARCFEIGLPFALLVPLTALEGASKRIPAYVKADPRPQIIVMGRVRFTTPTGLQGRDSNPTFGVCWLTWKLGLPYDLGWWHEGEIG